MKVSNVLVFPAGTEIAFEINKALRDSRFIKLFGATSVACHAEMMFDRCVKNLPYADDPAVISALNECIDHFGIDYVYPAHDSALLKLTLEQDNLNAKVVTSDANTVWICRSKNRTYKYLYAKGADYLPRFYESIDDITEWPVFIKPAVGQGSEGAVKINSSRVLRVMLKQGIEYAICEYLPGDEVTVDCFTDRHGTLRYVGQRSRERIRSGIAVRSRTLPLEDEVKEIAEDLNRNFRFNGAWFFQLKQDRCGRWKLMEVAPRIAGTMGLTRNLGINMPLLTMYNMWGVDVEILNNKNQLLLDRAFISRFKSGIEYDKVFIDFDDTLIQDGRVNPLLMAFLYQAKSKGKELNLITKHNGSIRTKLLMHNIDPAMFNYIIDLPATREKSDYVKGSAVFIDDSFSERKKVFDTCGVPVFDIDAVESLLDWSA